MNSAMIARADFWRRTSAARRGPRHKEWSHFCVLHPEVTLLVNWSLIDGPGRALIDRRSLPLPPEPLRWLMARGLSGMLSAVDRRVDRKARAVRLSGDRGV